jgi:pimeloyl-ACP methyl ester carboxylesterase
MFQRQNSRGDRECAMKRFARRILVLTLVLGVLSGTTSTGSAQQASPSVSATSGDFAQRVDIGGRSLYLECQGTGSPTVVLEAGYRASARYWTDDLLEPEAQRTMVLAGVASYTRVCAYDRPGTVASGGDNVLSSRSDAVPQPRTATDAVADLHALLGAAGVPGPYVLAGHSLGGLFARLYAATYPDEVVGLVLVDPYSERIESLMTPEQWAALVRLNVDSGSDTVLQIPGYGDLETIGYGTDNPAMRRAAAETPLHSMPLAVLAHVRPFDLPRQAEGVSFDELERIFRAANEWQATLVPNARFFAADASGHDIHQDQPTLVTEAIRQVVAGVRDADTWYDMTACCVN